MKILQSTLKAIQNNKQLLLGLGLGALIMLPTGLYLNERYNNHRTHPTETVPVTSPQDIDLSEESRVSTAKELSEEKQQHTSTTPTTKPQQQEQPAYTNPCDMQAMQKADQKYDQALLANSKELGKKLDVISAEVNNPDTTAERMTELMRQQDEANAQKNEKDRQTWNTHVTELAQAGCSRGQSYE